MRQEREPWTHMSDMVAGKGSGMGRHGEAWSGKTLHVRGRARESISRIIANTSANTAPQKPWG